MPSLVSNYHSHIVKRYKEPHSDTMIYSKHLKTHTKPFQCSEPDCNHLAANSRDLQRHLRTHGTKAGDKSFSCPYLGCEHSQDSDKEPFKRLNHTKRHIVRKRPIPIVI
jgi:hypothetical protein